MVHVTKREEVLNEALRLTTGDRNTTHGEPVPQFGQTAGLWSAYLGVPITSGQVVVCNLLQKISRSCHGIQNPDDITDAVGYAALWAEVVDER